MPQSVLVIVDCEANFTFPNTHTFLVSKRHIINHVNLAQEKSGALSFSHIRMYTRQIKMRLEIFAAQPAAKPTNKARKGVKKL